MAEVFGTYAPDCDADCDTPDADCDVPDWDVPVCDPDPVTLAPTRITITTRAKPHFSEITCLCAHSAKHLIVGYKDGSIHCYNFKDGFIRVDLELIARLEFTLEGHFNEVSCMALSNDCNTLFSASLNGCVKKWDVSLESAKSADSKEGSAMAESSSAFADTIDVSMPGTIDTDTADDLKLTEPMEIYATGHSRRPLFSLIHHSTGVLSICLSEDGLFFATGNIDGVIRVNKAENGESVLGIQGGTGLKREVTSLVFAPGGKSQAVSSSNDNLIKLWDAVSSSGSWKQVHCVEMSAPQTTIEISPDSSLLATVDANGLVSLLDVSAEFRTLFTLDAKMPVSDLRFAPTMYWLCICTESGVSIVDLETKLPSLSLAFGIGEETTERPRLSHRKIIWSVDGTMLFFGADDGTLGFLPLSTLS